MRKIHYQIIASEGVDEKGNFKGPVSIDILDAVDEEHALSKAKKMVTDRTDYRLFKVWECHTCVEDKKTKELIEEQLKFLKSQNKEHE